VGRQNIFFNEGTVMKLKNRTISNSSSDKVTLSIYIVSMQ
jgi:hypothetical protein